jgi:hypothetical protein
MKRDRESAGSLEISDDLTEHDLDQICALFELLDRWDRAECEAGNSSAIEHSGPGPPDQVSALKDSDHK